jgi:high-affinity iron transporter
MLVAAFFVITMVIFMMKTGRKLKGQIEGKVGLLAGNDAWIGLFFFVFLMVLREGAETVLILSAVTLNSTELMSFLGTLLGVLCAIAFGVMFVKGSVRINLQKFFRVTTAILFLVAAQLVIAGLHELSESGVIPSSKTEMAIIGPIVRNDLFFFVTIFALAALMVLFDAKRREPVLESPSAAERRKALWTARKERVVDGFGVWLLVCVHRAGDGGVYLYQERERAVAGGRSELHERRGEDSAGAGFGW